MVILVRTVAITAVMTILTMKMMMMEVKSISEEMQKTCKWIMEVVSKTKLITWEEIFQVV